VGKGYIFVDFCSFLDMLSDIAVFSLLLLVLQPCKWTLAVLFKKSLSPQHAGALPVGVFELCYQKTCRKFTNLWHLWELRIIDTVYELGPHFLGNKQQR